MAADTNTGLRAYLPPAIRTFPADLAAIIGLVFLTVLSAVLPGVRGTYIRAIFAIPMVVFIPGYAFIAALFPKAGTNETNNETSSENERDIDEESITPDHVSGISGMERVALSFGTSIAIVPLIGLVLNETPWGIRLVPVFVSISGFTLAAAFVGARRRAVLEPEDRFAVPYKTWIARAREELLEPDTKADVALNVLMIAGLLLAVGSVGYAVTVPQTGESFTEFYLLTENETGELVTEDYPSEFVAGEPKPVILGISNQEHDSTSYMVVVEIQRVQIENGTATVEESEMLQQFSPTLEHNETWQQRHQVAPTMTGERLRLTYLLYEGDPPSNPTTENAYRELHLWVNVAES